ncbi:MAG TPA: c-type cytochrome [Gammaproteobacteria bacterium]
MSPRSICLTVLVSTMLACGACGKSQGGTQTAPAAAPPDHSSSTPLGQRAGTGDSAQVLSTENPYEGSKDAAREGQQIYLAMNCTTCHAYDGSGNQGPDLTDTRWRYGGLPIQIFNSIHDGRPKGMPSWKDKLTDDQIWKLVSYVESFGGSFPARFWQKAPQGDVEGENEAPEAQSQFMTPVPGTVPPATAATKPPR